MKKTDVTKALKTLERMGDSNFSVDAFSGLDGVLVCNIGNLLELSDAEKKRLEALKLKRLEGRELDANENADYHKLLVSYVEPRESFGDGTLRQVQTKKTWKRTQYPLTSARVKIPFATDLLAAGKPPFVALPKRDAGFAIDHFGPAPDHAPMEVPARPDGGVRRWTPEIHEELLEYLTRSAPRQKQEGAAA